VGGRLSAGQAWLLQPSPASSLNGFLPLRERPLASSSGAGRVFSEPFPAFFLIPRSRPGRTDAGPSVAGCKPARPILPTAPCPLPRDSDSAPGQSPASGRERVLPSPPGSGTPAGTNAPAPGPAAPPSPSRLQAAPPASHPSVPPPVRFPRKTPHGRRPVRRARGRSVAGGGPTPLPDRAGPYRLPIPGRRPRSCPPAAFALGSPAVASRVPPPVHAGGLPFGGRSGWPI